MLQKKKKESQKNKERLSSYVKYSGIAFQMIAIILIGVFGGMKIDKWLNTDKPVFTALLSVLAVILAIYYSIKDLIRDEGLRKKVAVREYVTDRVGLPTLNDIMSELSKPGRDPREQFELFSFADDINTIENIDVTIDFNDLVVIQDVWVVSVVNRMRIL